MYRMYKLFFNFGHNVGIIYHIQIKNLLPIYYKYGFFTYFEVYYDIDSKI